MSNSLPLSPKKVSQIISDALDEFYKRRLNKLSGLKLNEVLKKKNPYLFRSIGVSKADEIVSFLLQAYMSSSEEGMFGDAFFEPIAVKVSGGNKSITEGVDVEVHIGNRVKAFAVKSGPNVYNAGSWENQKVAFRKCKARINSKKLIFEPIVGFGYGQKKSKDGVEPRQTSGQAFWEELTGDSDFYLKLMDLMEDKPVKHLPLYQEAYNAAVNRFTLDFIKDFCFETGHINWRKLTEFNSSKRAGKLRAKRT